MSGTSHRKMRVCHVTTMDYIAAFVIRGELTGLRERGFEVHVIAPRGRYHEELRSSGFVVHDVTIPRMIQPLSMLKAYRDLAQIFRHEVFDVVHTHQAVSGFLGRIAARRAGTPLVVHTEHGLPMYRGQFLPLFHIYRLASKYAGRYCDFVFSENREDLENLVAWKVVGPEKVRYQGTGIDVRAAERQRQGSDRRKLREELGLPEDAFVFLMSARFEAIKDHRFLFRVLETAWFRDSSAVCVLAGKGRLLERFRRRARAMAVGERIRFLGFRDDLQRLLPAFDAFVLTSRKEGVPHAVQEASLAGLPVVATDVLGTREAVSPGENGFLVAPGDVRGFAASLEALERDGELRHRLGACGRADALERFGIDNVTRRLTRVYVEQARSSSSGTSPETR